MASNPGRLRQQRRYRLFGEIASGGMATVHLGRLRGPAGFARTVAIKRMHPHLAKEAEFVAMFVDEARLASRIVHPHTVSTLDVIAEGEELLLVMEYVHGESLGRLVRAAAKRELLMEPALGAAIMAGALRGLHAVHEALSDGGDPLRIVHRDVSPENILIGADGLARVLDFGVAKAAFRLQTTRDGQIKGKLAYSAPEQLRGEPVDRRADVFAAGIVHWEILTGRRLFGGGDVGEIAGKVLTAEIRPPSTLVPELSEDLDDLVMRALARDPSRRYQTADDYAIAIEQAMPPSSPRQVAEWVQSLAEEALRQRSNMVAEIERDGDRESYGSARVAAPGAGRVAPKLAVAAACVAIAGGALLVRSRSASSSDSRDQSGLATASLRAAPPSPPPAERPTEPIAAKPRRAPAPVRAAVERRHQNCDPPYHVDDRGIRRIKPGCA